MSISFARERATPQHSDARRPPLRRAGLRAEAGGVKGQAAAAGLGPCRFRIPHAHWAAAGSLEFASANEVSLCRGVAGRRLLQGNAQNVFFLSHRKPRSPSFEPLVRRCTIQPSAKHLDHCSSPETEEIQIVPCTGQRSSPSPQNTSAFSWQQEQKPEQE